MKTLKQMLKLIRVKRAYRTHRPRRILFDHLPKCAGTTVTEYLSMHYPRRFSFAAYGQRPDQLVKKFQSLSEDSRYRYQLILGHRVNDLLDYVHPDRVALTIFRDPVDRVISHYYHVKRQKQHYLHDQVAELNIQLEDYILTPFDTTELRNFYTTHFANLTIREVEQAPEEAVRRAFQTITKRYDIIGFQDDLPAVMRTLRNAANLYEPFDNNIRNKSGNRIELEEVSENAKKTIAEVNFLDVKLYALLKAHTG